MRRVREDHQLSVDRKLLYEPAAQATHIMEGVGGKRWGLLEGKKGVNESLTNFCVLFVTM